MPLGGKVCLKALPERNQAPVRSRKGSTGESLTVEIIYKVKGGGGGKKWARIKKLLLNAEAPQKAEAL